ncbi:MAG: minor capsid protein [Clostridia bacterium]|nr:minor capsid protein [Clostridia bacterium]
MNDVFMGKDWDETVEKLIDSLKFIRGLYSSDVKEEEKFKKHLKKQVTDIINELYKTVSFNNESEKLILEYGKKGENFLNELREETEKATQTTINIILSVIDEKDSLFKNYNKTINTLKKVLEKRKKAFEEMLSDYAGQMLRYMLLWDCEKSGYTRYQFVTEGDNCEECSSLDGQVFDIKDAKSGINLAPMHPNCDCGAAVLDKNGGVVMMVGGKESKQNNQNTYNGIFAPMLRIPKDAAKILKSYYNAQIERVQKIKNPLSFLDWVTMGMVSGAWQGMQQRADKMLETPSAYNIGNWLTVGLLDTAKGAINPNEPLSLEHWLDSAVLASTVVGAYKAGKAVGDKGTVINYKKEIVEELNEHIIWDSWENYEKVFYNGQTYAKVGSRLYSKHAVERMQPSGKRYTVGDAIKQAGGVEGRSVSPIYVEEVIKVVQPEVQLSGNLSYVSGSLEVITNQQGCVVTIMIKKEGR